MGAAVAELRFMQGYLYMVERSSDESSLDGLDDALAPLRRQEWRAGGREAPPWRRMRRERRGHPPRLSWAEATAAYLLATDYTRSTRETYRGHLSRAGRQLGKVQLGQLTAEDLAAYRAAVMGSRRGTKNQALTVVRVFLVWAAEHALVGLAPATIRELLRPPGAAAGVEPMGRTARWRKGARQRG